MAGILNIPDKIRFLDFAPDAELNTPGILLGAGNAYPTVRGWRNYPGLIPITTDVLPAKALGAYATVLGTTVVVVAGTADQLYLWDASGWTDQSLTLEAAVRWRFDQYGTVVIGVNGEDPPQAYNGTGNFAALGGSPPVASIVQASNYSLFLIAPNSNTWWSSLSATLWTPSIATQTVTGNLDENPGIITAAQRLRAGMALYKAKSLHFSQFIGPPFYWDFQLVSAQVGAPCQEAVANLGDIHYWPGTDDFYSFDGYTLNRVPNMLKDWFFQNLDGTQLNNIFTRWDQKQSLVFWHFPSRAASPAGTVDSWICLNVRNGKWGCSRDSDYGPEPIDLPVAGSIANLLTYDTLTTQFPTYADFNGRRYADFQSRTFEVTGVIRSSDRLLCVYSGSPPPLMLVTHDVGDYYNMFEVTRVKPRLSIYPQTGQVTVFNQYRPGEPIATDLSKALSGDGFFNFRNSSRMQRYKMVFEGDCEINGFDMELAYGGDR